MIIDETLRLYLGWVWYEVDFWVPKSWVNGVDNTRIVLRFESVHYNAIAWVNGVQVGFSSYVVSYDAMLIILVFMTSKGCFTQRWTPSFRRHLIRG